MKVIGKGEEGFKKDVMFLIWVIERKKVDLGVRWVWFWRYRIWGIKGNKVEMFSKYMNLGYKFEELLL